MLYKKELKKKKSEELKISNLNKKNFKKPKIYITNFTQHSINLERLKKSPNKTNINNYKEQNLMNKTTKGKTKYFKSFLNQKKKEEKKNEQIIENILKNNNKSEIKKEGIKENKNICLIKLIDFQKNEIIKKYKKFPNQISNQNFKDNIQKKLGILQSKGYNIEDIFNNSDNEIKKEKEEKVNLYRKNNMVEKLTINGYESKNIQNNKYNHKTNKIGILINSYSNINILKQNKKLKLSINAIKPKINTLEFIKKIKQKIPQDKNIFNTKILKHKSYEENENEIINNDIKNVINNYIKIKRKERKVNEIKKREKINQENFKKYENFRRLQENIKESLVNEINKKKNYEEEKFDYPNKIEIFNNTNKSSVFNENDFYLKCYEAQNIFNSKSINFGNIKNDLCKSLDYHINLNGIKNKNNEIKNERNQKLKKFYAIDELYKVHINNLKRKNKKKENNCKLFIEKIINAFTKIKKKYFMILIFSNSVQNFMKKILKAIKYSPFHKIKNYTNKIVIIIKLKNILYKLFLNNSFLIIKLYAKTRKFLMLFIKIKKIYLKNSFNNLKRVIQKYNIIKPNDLEKEENNNKEIPIENNIKTQIFEEKLNNNYNNLNSNKFLSKEIFIENKRINLNKNEIVNEEKKQIYDNLIDDEKNNLFFEEKYLKYKNEQEKSFLNNAFIHNQEIFKNLRYEDEDDFFCENEIKQDNIFENESINKEKNEIENETKKYFDKIPKNIKENIEKELTEQILKELIDTEINKKEKIINKKLPIIQFENKQKEISSSKNISNSNNNSISDSSLEINNSLLKKSIGEIKEGRKLNSYYNKKFPIFLKMIENNIKNNYTEIIDNLKNPFIIDEEKYINKISYMLNRNNINKNIHNEIDLDNINQSKILSLNDLSIPYSNKNLIKTKFIDEKILKEFNVKNETMNNESNEETINVSKYDLYLNKCVYDSINEIIEKRRKYNDLGEPLLWSSRNKIIKFNFDNSEYSKKIFIKEVMNELKEIINKKIGLIPENYDYMSLEHLISDREKKFIKNIRQNLLENEEKEEYDLDLVFTSLLMNISKLIMQQIIEEVIQILNLVEQSRKYPSKFESKSIYAYDNEDDIPIFGLGGRDDSEEDNFAFQ